MTWILVGIIIVADFYWLFMTGKARQSSLEPAAVDSILGWVLSGPYETKVRPISATFVSSHVLKLATEPSLDRKPDFKLKKFWGYEAFNTNTNTESSDFILKKLESQITFNGDKYEVLFPWKMFHKPFSVSEITS